MYFSTISNVPKIRKMNDMARIGDVLPVAETAPE
jgi:hypothetical protein